MLQDKIKKFCAEGRTIEEIAAEFRLYRENGRSYLLDAMMKLVNSGQLVMIESLGVKKYYTEYVI